MVSRLCTWGSLVLGSLMLSAQGLAVEVDKAASYKDSTAGINGISHITLSVADMDKMLDFYQRATGFALVSRHRHTAGQALDALYGADNVDLETAVLQAPNMALELVAFARNKGKTQAATPFFGPGMTHTCYQSSQSPSSYTAFAKAGAAMLSRGEAPVDLGGYGVTYAYGHDPEGNMLEMEQLSEQVLQRAGYDPHWVAQDYPMWMTQVALVTPDIDRLMNFYQKVLAFKPYRTGEYSGNARMDDIVNFDGLHLKGGWFKMGDKSKVMEFWQFVAPQTPAAVTGHPTDLGYSFSIAVKDIATEYSRLSALGVAFFSEPQVQNGFWQVHARDIDGNVFALRQPVSP